MLVRRHQHSLPGAGRASQPQTPHPHTLVQRPSHMGASSLARASVAWCAATLFFRNYTCFLQKIRNYTCFLQKYNHVFYGRAVTGVRIRRVVTSHRESRRCSRDTYPESYITTYTSIQRHTAAFTTIQHRITTI